MGTARLVVAIVGLWFALCGTALGQMVPADVAAFARSQPALEHSLRLLAHPRFGPTCTTAPCRDGDCGTRTEPTIYYALAVSRTALEVAGAGDRTIRAARPTQLTSGKAFVVPLARAPPRSSLC